MRQLSMSDAMFVLTEQPQRGSNHIGMVFLFDPASADEPVTFDRLLALYEQRLPLARAFREKLARVPLDLDYPYWVNDKDFDLEFHVRHTGLPRPGNRKQFFAVVNRLMSLQIDMSRPLWETYFIEGLDEVDGAAPGSFALLFKMHHAAVDGISGMEMVTALLETEEEAVARMPKKAWRGEDLPDQRKLLLKAVGGGLTGPLKLTGALVKGLPAMAEKRRRQKSGEVVKPPKTKAPKTRFNAAVTAHRVLEGCSWPFAEIKRLKDAVAGATINDVMLAVVGGSMRRYLASKNELPKEPLVASVPISVRTEAQQGTGGNQVSMTFANLHTDIADPLLRLAAVGEAMRAVKDYNKAVDATSLTEATSAMPGMLFGLAVRTMMKLPPTDALIISNTVITNIPGPQGPMTLLGARYVAGFGTGPMQDGMGLFHIITSLAGVLSVGFNADREQLPDPEFYARCIEDSFNELRDAIDARPAEAAPPALPAPKDAAGEPDADKDKPAKNADTAKADTAQAAPAKAARAKAPSAKATSAKAGPTKAAPAKRTPAKKKSEAAAQPSSAATTRSRPKRSSPKSSG
ncbi:MAG: wax ester/triacylglycerol synthase family O-acyltransferase [Novosphingobium sp.]